MAIESDTRRSYRTTIQSSITPGEALRRIGEVWRWWAKDVDGAASTVGDLFTVRFASGDRYTLRVAELEPAERVVWDVTDAFQGWVDNPTEWVGTRIVWTVSPRPDGTSVQLEHVGLVPDLQCFERCTGGWTYLVHDSLAAYLAGGSGQPA
jgi:hypothetical protein